ncbi:reticulon-like protein B5 isoform X2 [Ricinus communis]|uniref:reticulon-like protein B5 isoform X2 n=1 Tax=Ricinus communis TaxID=3988 RepID=UPI00201B25C1|nr:reticulon-like protein B5 isoform X2 [Ricinus communis]
MVEEPADAFNPELVNEIKARDTEHDHKHSSSSSSSSSSDSEIDNYVAVQSAQKNRLFGRQKPLHLVLGGGKPADIILWRNKQASGCVFAVATVLWLLFECAGYTLLTFLCHSLILSFATLFLWSNLATFLNMSPPEFPRITVPEDLLVAILLWLRGEINRAFLNFRDVALGKDLKKFLSVIAVLWVISVVGSWFSFLTLFYLEIHSSCQNTKFRQG